MANGYLSSSQLAPIAGGGYLRKDAAAAWNAMALEIYKATSTRIQVTGSDSAYRTYARQVYWRSYWCARGACQNAAIPGTSNHGEGIAVDVPDYVRILIAKYGRHYGWNRACSDAPWELWHHKWCGGWGGRDPGPGYSGKPRDRYPTLKKGSKRRGAVKRMQKHLRRWNVGLIRPEVDGKFGTTTKRALKQFQATSSLKVDGVCGKKTWKKLRKKDDLFQKERAWVNELKLIRYTGKTVSNKERKKADRLKRNIYTRARAIQKRAREDGWKKDKRAKRFKVLKAQVPEMFNGLYD